FIQRSLHRVEGNVGERFEAIWTLTARCSKGIVDNVAEFRAVFVNTNIHGWRREDFNLHPGFGHLINPTTMIPYWQWRSCPKGDESRFGIFAQHNFVRVVFLEFEKKLTRKRMCVKVDLHGSPSLLR